MHRHIANRVATCRPGWRLGSAAIALLIAGTGTAFGQPARTFEELRTTGRLAVGDTAIVEDTGGRKVRGTVEELGSGSLTLRIDSARSLTDRVFPQDEVRRIRRAGKPLMVMSGLVGAGTAFTVTAIAAASYGSNEGGRFCGGCLVEWSTLTVPVGAGVGALVGLAIDLSRVRTVYDRRTERASLALAPIISRGTIGATAAIRF
jgi:hypothetical protein